MSSNLANPVDLATVGHYPPPDSTAVGSIGYIRSVTAEDLSDPGATMIDLLLEQFRRPILDGDI